MLHVGSFQWLLLCLVWQPLWISEISKEVSGGAGHLSSSRGNKSLALTFVMEKCVSHIKNKIKSSLCSQDPHLSQAESLQWFKVNWEETVFSALWSVNKEGSKGNTSPESAKMACPPEGQRTWWEHALWSDNHESGHFCTMLHPRHTMYAADYTSGKNEQRYMLSKHRPHSDKVHVVAG